MMENVLFDSNCADKLNRLIQSRIAPHLFIICNYNPNIFDVFSEDAKFLQGITNLYKFTIDTSLINKINYIDRTLGGNLWRKNNKRLKELNNYLETISYLRTFSSHNNDHNMTITMVESWMIQNIHKKRFETIDDYKLAVKELERIGDKTYVVVTDILNSMIKEYPRNKLIDIFQDQILVLYRAGKYQLFKEELRAAYVAHSTTHSLVKDNTLALWCQKVYIGKQEEKIGFYSGYLKSTTGKKRKNIEEIIQRLNDEIVKTQKSIAQKSNDCKGNIARLRSYDYMNYYFEDRLDQCIKELPNIRKKNLTMLPQDMIQYIISKDFISVPADLY